MNIQDVIRRNEDELLKKPNVVGIGEGEQAGKPVIKVLVTHMPGSAVQPDELIPKMLEGYDVVVEESGVLQAQPQAEPQ